MEGCVWVPAYNWAEDLCMGYIKRFPQGVAKDRAEKAGGYTVPQARSLLVSTLMDNTFATPGRRNDDAVNVCIALYGLGFDATDDPDAEHGIWCWVRDYLAEDCRMQSAQINAFLKHVERVIPYVENWWRSGKFLDYTIKRS